MVLENDNNRINIVNKKKLRFLIKNSIKIAGYYFKNESVFKKYSQWENAIIKKWLM